MTSEEAPESLLLATIIVFRTSLGDNHGSSDGFDRGAVFVVGCHTTNALVRVVDHDRHNKKITGADKWPTNPIALVFRFASLPWNLQNFSIEWNGLSIVVMMENFSSYYYTHRTSSM
jgi:hypothetical protein